MRDRQPLVPAPLRLPAALREYLREEAAGGIVLMAAAAVALAWANSPWRAAYAALWETRVAFQLGRLTLETDLRHLVNEGLMTLFFLVVGLEIKRELVVGELRTWRGAALPVVAAAAGMAVPAALYAAVNADGPGAAGWGVPMATDIAFALGVLALLGPRVPAALKVFLLTLAVVDDLGSILVVALFYSQGVSLAALAVAAGLLLVAAGPRRAGDGPVAGPLALRGQPGAGRGRHGAAHPGAADHATRGGPRPRPGARPGAGRRPEAAAAPRDAAGGARHGVARRAAGARPAPADRVRGGAVVRARQRRCDRRPGCARRRRRRRGARRHPPRPRGGQAGRHHRGRLAGGPARAGHHAGRRKLAPGRRGSHGGRDRLHRAAVRRRPGLPQRPLRRRRQAGPAARLGARRRRRRAGPGRGPQAPT